MYAHGLQGGVMEANSSPWGPGKMSRGTQGQRSRRQTGSGSLLPPGSATNLQASFLRRHAMLLLMAQHTTVLQTASLARVKAPGLPVRNYPQELGAAAQICTARAKPQ